MRTAGIVLAAGAGSRFVAAGGGHKMLAPYRGRPLVEAPLAALAAAGLDDLVLVLGNGADDVLAAVDLHGARPVRNERWGDGMATTLRAGLAALDDACEVAVIAPGDSPRLSTEAVRRVLAASERGVPVVSAAYDGERGHPVALARAVWADLPETGEAGGRALGVPELVDCSDLGAPGDADTPDELASG